MHAAEERERAAALAVEGVELRLDESRRQLSATQAQVGDANRQLAVTAEELETVRGRLALQEAMAQAAQREAAQLEQQRAGESGRADAIENEIRELRNTLRERLARLGSVQARCGRVM